MIHILKVWETRNKNNHFVKKNIETLWQICYSIYIKLNEVNL
jgi:hypothetical protein